MPPFLPAPGRLQFAALPWRIVKGELEVLLVTTLTTRRWIVPKGWPLPACSPSECAAREALEEAGVVGEIDSAPFGSFRYAKLLKSGETVTCTVDVYPLKVRSRRRKWAERKNRKSLWCSPAKAVKRIEEPGLRRLILKFARSHART